jgi:small subunit ribosomal protein S13
MHILGIIIPDHLTTRVKLSILLSAKNLILLVQFALRRIYGVGDHIAHRLCARLQVHDRCNVKDLTPFQVTSLASFLSSPATALPLPRFPLAPLNYSPPPSSISTLELQTIFDEAQKKKKKKNVDPLRKLKIESELRNEIRENIGHQRMIGSYVGRRHAMNLPVRGQNTQNNARTAKKLNKLDRY